jgi:hypothetical protein
VRPHLAPLLAAVVVAVASDPYAFDLRARVALGLAVIALAAALLVMRRGPARAAPCRELVLLAGLSLAIVAGRLATDPTVRNPAGYATAVAAVLAACAAYLVLTERAEHLPGPSAGAPVVSRWLLPVTAASAFIVMAAVLLVLRENRPLIVDEVQYLFQATTLDEPGFGRAVEGDLVGFFILPLSFVADGRLHGQYPVGWPALLAIADAAGLRSWAGALLGATAVVVTYAIGRRLMPQWGAALAAGLLAVNGMFLDIGGTYFAHVPTAACLLLGALFLLRAEERRGVARDAEFVAAGLALGVATAIRPLTGVAVGASVILWCLLRGRLRGRTGARMLAIMTLGAAAPISAILYYNAATTGDALLFGYTKAHGALLSLGFGLRGQVVYDSLGMRRPLVAAFTPAIAVRNFVMVGTTFVGALLPGVSAAIPLVVARRAFAGRHVALTAASFLVLPLLHFFVFYPDVRYYTELLPFAALGISWLLLRLRTERPAMASALVAFVLAASAVAAAGRLRFVRVQSEMLLESVTLIERAHRGSGPILVFVSDPVSGESMLARLWAYNSTSFQGEIVVARDLGERNIRLVEALPGRAVFRLRRTGGTTAALTRLP